MAMSERGQVQTVFEQELASVLLRALRLAEREGEPPSFRDGVLLILKVLEERREARTSEEGPGR